MKLFDLLLEIKNEVSLYSNEDVKNLLKEFCFTVIEYRDLSHFNYQRVIYTSTLNTVEFRALKNEFEDAGFYITYKPTGSNIRTRVSITNYVEEDDYTKDLNNEPGQIIGMPLTDPF